MDGKWITCPIHSEHNKNECIFLNSLKKYHDEWSQGHYYGTSKRLLLNQSPWLLGNYFYCLYEITVYDYQPQIESSSNYQQPITIHSCYRCRTSQNTSRCTSWPHNLIRQSHQGFHARQTAAYLKNTSQSGTPMNTLIRILVCLKLLHLKISPGRVNLLYCLVLMVGKQEELELHV